MERSPDLEMGTINQKKPCAYTHTAACSGHRHRESATVDLDPRDASQPHRQQRALVPRKCGLGKVHGVRLLRRRCQADADQVHLPPLELAVGPGEADLHAPRPSGRRRHGQDLHLGRGEAPPEFRYRPFTSSSSLNPPSPEREAHKGAFFLGYKLGSNSMEDPHKVDEGGGGATSARSPKVGRLKHVAGFGLAELRFAPTSRVGPAQDQQVQLHRVKKPPFFCVAPRSRATHICASPTL